MPEANGSVVSLAFRLNQFDEFMYFILVGPIMGLTLLTLGNLIRNHSTWFELAGIALFSLVYIGNMAVFKYYIAKEKHLLRDLLSATIDGNFSRS